MKTYWVAGPIFELPIEGQTEWQWGIFKDPPTSFSDRTKTALFVSNDFKAISAKCDLMSAAAILDVVEAYRRGEEEYEGKWGPKDSHIRAIMQVWHSYYPQPLGPPGPRERWGAFRRDDHKMDMALDDEQAAYAYCERKNAQVILARLVDAMHPTKPNRLWRKSEGK